MERVAAGAERYDNTKTHREENVVENMNT